MHSIVELENFDQPGNAVCLRDDRSMDDNKAPKFDNRTM